MKLFNNILNYSLGIMFLFCIGLFFTQVNWIETRHSREYSSLSQEQQERLSSLDIQNKKIHSQMRDVEDGYEIGVGYFDLIHQSTLNAQERYAVWLNAKHTESFSRKIYTALGVVND